MLESEKLKSLTVAIPGKGIMRTRQSLRLRLIDEEVKANQASMSGRGLRDESSDIEVLDVAADVPLDVVVPEGDEREEGKQSDSSESLIGLRGAVGSVSAQEKLRLDRFMAKLELLKVGVKIIVVGSKYTFKDIPREGFMAFGGQIRQGMDLPLRRLVKEVLNFWEVTPCQMSGNFNEMMRVAEGMNVELRREKREPSNQTLANLRRYIDKLIDFDDTRPNRVNIDTFGYAFMTGQNDPVDVISDNESAEQSSSSTKHRRELSSFSNNYGRVKPNIVAYGQEIMGSKISTGCKSLSGISVASPSSCSLESYEILKRYRSRASIFPSILDYTDHPYSWPFSRQLLYAGAMPVIFNATILNGMGLIGYVEGQPTWHPNNDEENLLSIHFYSKIIWPRTGYLALHMQIKDEGAQFSRLIEGNVTVNIFSPPPPGEKGQQRQRTCVIQLKLKVVPTPPREKRIHWDQYHSIKYPPRYIPRDSLEVRNDILDWYGDYMHTNFHIMLNMLRNSGYYVETLGSPLTCFDAREYGTLLMVDLEEEIEKLRDDILNAGLGLVVFTKWYNVDTMVKMIFYDDNPRSWWTPIIGGANISPLYDLLSSFGIAFGDKISKGDFFIDGE
ncbi:hypothetical protein GIB67_022262 [Kingdonia uniflora]|uniref:Uncharacterized protein n=1 Tax=Kingdonia uniflora TaxID=39325 RepID=A0A7J7M762_9MAGN|nr:hypothetical protein GIB67_022262 [Kingdonia uniflora]